MIAQSVPRPAQFSTFRGSLAWLLIQEGHVGKPYWPGGASGVTLDPGYDLGHGDPDILSLYATETPWHGYSLSEEANAKLVGVIGLTGERARTALKRVLEIRITRAVAASLLPRIAAPYWATLTRNFGMSLGMANERSSITHIHTALLSLAFNRGVNNPLWKNPSFIEKIEMGYWDEVASKIAVMQQNHKLPGIRARRKAEAALIMSAL